MRETFERNLGIREKQSKQFISILFDLNVSSLNGDVSCDVMLLEIRYYVEPST